MHFLPVAAGLLTVLTTSVSAQGYDSSSPCDEFLITINDQTDLDTYSNCTTIEDWFAVNHTFSGPFVEPGIKSIGRFIAGYLAPKLRNEDRVEDRVTSVSMPDLETVTSEGILLAYLDNLTDVSFPKLRSVAGDIVILDDYGVHNLSLPSLSNVTGGVWLEGHFDQIDLPSLKDVAYLKISSIGDLDCRALGTALNPNLTFHPKAYDIDVGFTCWTPYEDNQFNSSDPKSVASGTISLATATATGAASTSTSSSTSGAGKNEVLGLASVAMAVFIGLLI